MSVYLSSRLKLIVLALSVACAFGAALSDVVTSYAAETISVSAGSTLKLGDEMHPCPGPRPQPGI